MGNIRLNASGKVTITIGNNAKYKKFTRSNTILPLFADVVARSLGNFSVANINYIKIYKQGLLLATAPITQYTHPQDNVVQFNANFMDTSFSGDFDGLGLYADAMGKIAELSGVAGNKANTDQLSITWTITINI